MNELTDINAPTYLGQYMTEVQIGDRVPVECYFDSVNFDGDVTGLQVIFKGIDAFDLVKSISGWLVKCEDACRSEFSERIREFA